MQWMTLREAFGFSRLQTPLRPVREGQASESSGAHRSLLDLMDGPHPFFTWNFV
ncbi:MAG: hypothetical protein ACI841_005238, partial [Planctomycetota bacterium]